VHVNIYYLEAKHMNSRHILSVGVVLSVGACALGVGETVSPQQEEPISVVSQPPYPSDYNNEPQSVEHSDNWDCGVEVIELEAPDGSIYLVEIPMLCDPQADQNLGCPPENLAEKSNKKASE
jgi:hypothetical protein